MSRFIEVFDRYRGKLSRRAMRAMLREIKTRLCAEEAGMVMRFDYFVTKRAPVSGAESLLSYACTLEARLDAGDCFQQVIQVAVPVLTLCPCSREISDRGAHNQRTIATVRIASSKLFWIEDIAALVESCASSPIYSLLKREDEKQVTEDAYDNPRFVEDIVREIADRLDEWSGMDWYSVEAESFESIHNHNAYACIERRFPRAQRETDCGGE